MRVIPTKSIVGQPILGENLYTVNGKGLLKAGVALTPNKIKKINENKIFSVYIHDQHSDYEVRKLIPQSIRVDGIILIKDLFDQAISGGEILGLHNKLMDYAEDVIYEMTGIRDKQIEYMDIKNVDSYIYSSSLNVALMSVLLAWELSIPNDMIKQIFIGAIYHDIGMAMIPKDVYNKAKDLTIEEKMMIINHPKKGYDFLKEKGFLSAYVKGIALQHHEAIDGSGYPNRAKGEDISKYAQIIGISDVYDAMTSDRPYRRAVSAKEAVEYIMGSAGSKYDIELANAFVKKINPYPKGSIVKLSTGETAVVDETYKDLPLRPRVRVISGDKDRGYNYQALDLMKNPSVVIDSIVYEDEI